LQSPAIIIHTIMIDSLYFPGERKSRFTLLSPCNIRTYYTKWVLFWSILHSYNRRAELTRLVGWAEKRRVVGPLNLYKSRLVDEELRLMRYSFRFPRMRRIAYILHILSNLISSKPKYHPRGSAAHFRSHHGKRQMK
jgi:hypothetical protein